MMCTRHNTIDKHLDTMKIIWLGRDQRCDRLVFLEKGFLFFLCLSMFLTPGLWIRHLGGLWGRESRKKWVEIYAIAKVTATMAILYFHLWSITCVAIVCGWLLSDVFISLAGYIFLRKFWQNPYSWNRSLLLLCLNFIEYTSWFACLYLAYGLLKQNNGEIVTTATSAVYFSVVTAATVGYGDITAVPGTGRLVVTVEICASLFFLATVVSYFVSNMSREEEDKKSAQT